MGSICGKVLFKPGAQEEFLPFVPNMQPKSHILSTGCSTLLKRQQKKHAGIFISRNFKKNYQTFKYTPQQ